MTESVVCLLQVIDLLNNSHRRYLSVRWSKNKGFYVENLFTVECETLDDLMAVLEEGRCSSLPVSWLFVCLCDGGARLVSEWFKSRVCVCVRMSFLCCPEIFFFSMWFRSRVCA